jgi:hypothetical protein
MDSGMRKNSKKVTTGSRQPCDILHHWSEKGHLSSYQLIQHQLMNNPKSALISKTSINL